MNRKKRFLLSFIILLTLMLIACGHSEDVISENLSTDTITEESKDTENDTSSNMTEETIENTETEETKDSETSDESDEANSESEFDEVEDVEEPKEPEFVVKDYDAVLFVKNPVNVRKGPSTDYDVIGGLEKGKQITVTGLVDTGWYRIQYNDENAYVYSSYLIDEASYQAMIAEEEALAKQQQQQQQATPEPQQPAPEPQQPAPEPQQPAPEPQPTPEPQQPQVNPADYKAQVVAIINQERANAGLGSVSQNASLDAVAQIRAQEIAQSFSHTRPDGTNCFTILDQYGIPNSAAGENIAAGYGTPEEVMTGWMNSDGHRANILNGSFGQVGIGYYTDPNGVYGTYWVQMFTN